MKKKAKKWVSTALCAAAAAAMLSGCGSSGEDTSTSTESSTASASSSTADGTVTEGEQKYPEFITIDVYDSQANFQGTQSGWFARIVKDKFNMELNMISPNVAGGGDTLYQTRSANGNLGDLIIIGADQNRLSDMVTAGLLTDMTPYMDGEENLAKYTDAIESCSALAGQDGMWAVPSEISQLPATEPCETLEPTNAADLRFDLYQQIGAPKIGTLEDLLPVLKDMQDAAGQSDSGKQVYALSLFKDWDNDSMQNASAFCALYGYDPQGFALLNVETGEKQSIIDNDSMYIRSLKFLFDANQMGLVDPESTSQNYDTLAGKFQDGAVLYSFWPWLGTGQYNSAEHTAEGKGFAVVGIDDAKYLCWGSMPVGKNSCAIMVGSKAQDPQRMVDFIDWLYSEEGNCDMSADTGGACGPQGLTWEMNGDEPVLTEFGDKAFIEQDRELQVPDEYGGGTWSDGISALNYKPLGVKDEMSNGVPYRYVLWDDYQEKTATKLSEDWSAWSGEKTALEYVQNNDMIAVVPGTNWATPEYDTETSAIKEQCRQIIVNYSWQMVFAQDEDTFNSLLAEMQETCEGLGIDKVLEQDFANCDARYQLFEKARED